MSQTKRRKFQNMPGQLN